MSYLISALEIDRKIVQKRVLKCVYWALIQSEYRIKITPDKRMALERLIGKLI